LQGHIERMHRQSKAIKTCTTCNKSLRGAQCLRDHIYYYHTPKSCEVCLEQFPGIKKSNKNRNNQKSVDTHLPTGSKFYFVVLVLFLGAGETLIRNQNTVLLSNFTMLSAYCTIYYALSGSLARKPCSKIKIFYIRP
jgi:hypothetical protein